MECLVQQLSSSTDRAQKDVHDYYDDRGGCRDWHVDRPSLCRHCIRYRRNRSGGFDVDGPPQSRDDRPKITRVASRLTVARGGHHEDVKHPQLKFGKHWQDPTPLTALQYLW
jgi:hypothetical protein